MRFSSNSIYDNMLDEPISEARAAEIELLDAAERGDLAQVERLTQSNTISLECKGWFGCTPLHMVSTSEMASFLISKGADTEALDGNDSTPLHAASVNGRTDLVSLLLHQGVKIDLKNKDNCTPLCHAVYYKRSAPVALLLEMGADPVAAADGKADPDATRNEDEAAKDKRAAKNKSFLKSFVENTSETCLELRAEAKLLMGLYITPPPVVVPFLSKEGGPELFISYQKSESDNEARWLKDELDIRGVSAFVSSVDVSADENAKKLVCKAMGSCRLMVVMGSLTYGLVEGTEIVNLDEVQIAEEYGIRVFVFQMCEKYQRIETAMALRGFSRGKWTHDKPLEQEALEALLRSVDKAGIRVRE